MPIDVDWFAVVEFVDLRNECVANVENALLSHRSIALNPYFALNVHF